MLHEKDNVRLCSHYNIGSLTYTRLPTYTSDKFHCAGIQWDMSPIEKKHVPCRIFFFLLYTLDVWTSVYYYAILYLFSQYTGV